MWRWGSDIFLDIFLLIVLGWYVFSMQYRLVWDGYGRMQSSYHKYEAAPNSYNLVEAEIVDSKTHILAGLRGIVACDIKYYTINYVNDGMQYSTYSKVFPDAVIDEKLIIAVSKRNPNIIERTMDYSFDNFHWGAQIIVFILEIIFIWFIIKIIQLYNTPEKKRFLKMCIKMGYIEAWNKIVDEKYDNMEKSNLKY
ncbi:MAG: hypothetical protein IJ661_10270 [Lachnospiraceae bacterium]|nr:hypothetical protein [Lachnospiraceae bacterium]